MAIYEPPNNYFNNINFNTDFYTIPNDQLNGISAAYANTHYLQIGGGTTPKSSSTSTYFAGSVNIGYSSNNQQPGYLTCQNIVSQYNIAGNNIYTNNTFYEANVPLSVKYQTNLLASKFYISKQYPPISLTTDPTTLISGQAYGNGNYTVTASSVFTGQEPFNAFRYPYVDGTYSWTTTGNSYTSGSGAFIGGTVTNVQNPSITGIYGEWMQIQLPTSLTLKSYTITGRKGVGASTYNPSAWTLAASMTGGTWYQIDSRSGITWSTSINTSYTFTPSDPTYGTYDWLYYRLIVTNTNGYVLATVMQLQLNLYSAIDNNSIAMTTGGLALGIGATNYLNYPNSLVVIGDSACIGNVACNKIGVGLSTPAYGLDVVSSNGCRIQSTTASSGYIVLQGSTTSSVLGSIVFFDGVGGSNGSIGGALVNGSYINMNTTFGITSGYSVNGNFLSSAIGIGTVPSYTRSIAINTSTAGQPAVSIYGSSSTINLNTDKIRIGYSSVAGLFALNSTIDDCIFVNSNNRFLFNPSASPYASLIMSSASSGTTSFINTSTGIAGVNIYGTGGISANTVNATNGISTGGSLTISGGAPNISGSYAAAAGSLTANNVTGVPVGYIYWGGGNATTVQAYSCPSGTSYSLKADNAILANGFISTSDKRVKRDIKSIVNSLEIIDKIEPKNYNMIETAENRYGFIAQEIEEILPNVVILSNDFIPNIFDYGTYDDKIITFDNKNNLEIVEGDEIKINYQSCRVNEVIDKNSFRIHKNLEVDENNKVFIMGTKVKDFKCINYDMITSINTASIKELHKIILKQQEQINLLISKLS